MPYAILRFQKRKAGGVTGTDRHNERRKETYKSNPDIKTEKSKENYHIVKPKGKYKDLCNERIKEAKCKIRKDSVILVETLLTASPEFLRDMNDEEQHKFFERAFTFIADRVDKKNIISAVVHMDETTPHMHLCFCPITQDNRLSAKRILGNRRNLEKWQDEYYEYMSKEYPTLERGIPVSKSHRKHIPTYMFKQASEIENGHEEIINAVKNISPFNATKKRNEALSVLERYIPLMVNFTSQTKRTDNYIIDLERTNTELNSQLKNQSNELSKQQAELFSLQSKLKYTKHEQEWVQSILDEVPKEVINEIMKNRKSKHRERN